MDLDEDELRATRRLNGLEDNLFKESDTNIANMTEEAFNELIDNFEVVAHLTMYGRKGIKENVKKLQARIKELEEESKKYIVQLTDEQYRNLVDIIREEVKKEFEQKVKDKIEEVKNMKFEDERLNSATIDFATHKFKELLEEK